ncbi:MBL fold metallo-hydrolase [Shimazuella alba]|uniref:MBL fold metallo-hydrolase n=1 Tax=Shimazuella alba TaxID=2690964 RepID=A0A6I4VV94_9BACL|nr:MBL fold metallo-hydrolase [Shimazuella alba]MXQ55467.1 MBL fold metallo-hydrolase [Shimazuella alba]
MSGDLENGKDYKYIPITSVTSHTGQEITTDLYTYNIQAVNVCMVGNKDDWVLVDTGMPKSTDVILAVVEERFGSISHPKAIVLTHGHFDHVGAVVDLVKQWNVPVYAHELEIPYLTGKQSYPKPDPSVEGGLIAKISNLFPKEPIHLGTHVEKLPSDGSVPEMKDWKWIHTPGHTPGHVSFFREKDRALIAGDAFITVRQDMLFKVLTQDQEISGPPRYFTTDWQSAFDSVKKLRDLHPSVAITGHGSPMSGQALSDGLQKLANEFNQIAVPDYGRYVH